MNGLSAITFLVWMSALLIASFAHFLTPALASDTIISFNGGGLVPSSLSSGIDYDLDPTAEKYFIHVPPNYTGAQPFGLIVYTSPSDECAGLPNGWADVLDRKQLFFIAAQHAGNDRSPSRRMGLAVLGALEMIQRYQINRARVFAAGLSGGARIAGDLGFRQSDIFHGTIQDCGSNFHRSVATRYAIDPNDTLGKPYGVSELSEEEIRRAKQSVRFALITGSNDFRRGNILDIYDDGFKREGFRSQLFDVQGMGHEDCNVTTLQSVLSFIDGKH